LVSKLNTGLGYDIASFNEKSDNMAFDRFIEVKGSGDPKVRFVWSSNEMKVAQELRDKYWIYYQGGIDKKTGTSNYEPVIFHDPHYNLPLNSLLSRIENGVVISGPIVGKKHKVKK
jgi:hypothetical protein